MARVHASTFIPLSFAIASLTATAATAQEAGQQTVENAQKFLEITLPTATLETSRWHGRGRITSAVVRDRCNQGFSASFPQFGQWAAGNFDGHRNWGGIAEVKATGTQIRVAYTDASIIDLIYFTSEAMATRVAYALQFLKVQCDNTAKLGF